MNSHTEKGLVFDIQRFSIHDGPGIRTTVFMKGCPLRCIWCHNPESQSSKTEISLNPSKCIGCGYCFEVCPGKCHLMKGKIREFHREYCLVCGKCTEKCYPKALEAIGREMTVGEVIGEVARDRIFYETSGGGMTLSGGEPLFQFEFTHSLLLAAKKEKISSCLETSGFAKWDRIEKLLGLVDIFLFDYKESSPEKHLEFTGVPMDTIMENLSRLDYHGTKIIFRCPIIPGCNDRSDHFRGIAEAANKFKSIAEINVMPYHPLGKSKNEKLGKTSIYSSDSMPDDAAIEGWLKEIKSHTSTEVLRG